MRPVHATTTSSAPVLQLLSGQANCDLYGLLATYAESATFFIKFWWQGNTNAVPILGNTAPNLTVPISAGAPGFLSANPIVAQGPVWWAATANAVDTDATALAGGDVITFFIE